MSNSISTAKTSSIIVIDDQFECRLNDFLDSENNHIFNEPRFFRLHQRSDKDIYVQLVRSRDRRVYATIAFYEQNGEYLSPRNGTFGGFGLNVSTDLALFEKFARAIFSYLTNIGAKKIIIKLAPVTHDVALFSVLYNVLARFQFVVSNQELSFDLQVDHRPLIERIDYGNAKRIRKCNREGFVSVKLGLEFLNEIYEVIAANRARRGFLLSMSFSDLQAMADEFPEKIHCFAVHAKADRSRLVAASVCIEVSSRVLYVFYWGDSAEMETYSPISMLASEIYEYCQKNSIRTLDVGTSTIEGVPNHGLVRFKRNLGCLESLKLTMSFITSQ